MRHGNVLLLLLHPLTPAVGLAAAVTAAVGLTAVSLLFQ